MKILVLFQFMLPIISLSAKEIHELKKVEDLEQLKRFESQREAFFVYFDKDSRGQGFQEFKSVSKLYDEKIFFFYTPNISLIQECDFSCIFFFKKFNKPKLVLSITNQTKDQEIRRAVMSQIPSLVAPFDGEIILNVFEKEKVGFFFITNDQEGDSIKQYKEFARERKSDKISFILCGNKQGFDKGLAEFLNLKDQDLPSIWIMQVKKGNFEKYKYQENSIDKLAMQKFLKEFEENKINPYYVSEEKPSQNNELVKIVVADTFKEMVIDQKKDVLFELYDPQCQNSKTLQNKQIINKKFKHIYDQLAKDLLENNFSMIVTKMNAVANEVPGLMHIQIFPTILLYPSDNKSQPIKYEGDNTEQDLKQFILENCKQNKEGLSSSI